MASLLAAGLFAGTALAHSIALLAVARSPGIWGCSAAPPWSPGATRIGDRACIQGRVDLEVVLSSAAGGSPLARSWT